MNNLAKASFTALLMLAATGLVAMGKAPTQDGDSKAIDWASVLAAEHRTEAYTARDQYRNPAQTLQFFGLSACDTVVEISPGGGWYTEVLAPVLAGCGKLYAAHFDPDAKLEYFRKSRQRFETKMAADPIYQAVEITTLAPPEHVAMAPAGSADAVYTFRNVHNWTRAGTADAVFAAAFAVLKPGGVFGVVEHRARPGTSEADMSRSGYVTEAKVKALAEKAGFRFVRSSEVNANPKDSADHPKGVWTLPPSLRLGDENRAHYLAIGESDRMTLLFEKPGV